MSETPSKGDAESTTTPSQVQKDKKCPFCHKDFTSSSLGRHLDLWIKETNAKAPDGLHDVDEIRKLRGAVTRRHYRKALSSRRDSSTSAATATPTTIAASKRSPPASEQHAHSTPSAAMVRKESAAHIPGFNVHHFSVTGVINDCDRDQGRPPSSVSHEVAAQRTHASQPNSDMVKKLQDAEDKARAAELALREMVGAWRAAKLQIDMGSMPFEFDPLALDFPALTLQCLPPPPTLSTADPYATDRSWSIQPPGEQQYTALSEYFKAEFRKWRIKCAAATTALQEDIQYPPSEAAFTEDPQEAVRRAERVADDLEKKVHDHVYTAYSRWVASPHQRRVDQWALELARSLGRKQQQIESMENDQHRLRQENTNLRSQIDQLNKLQQPREFKMMVPATLPFDKNIIDLWQEEAVVHGRRTVGMSIDDRGSDVGTVVGTAIDRWKRVVTYLRTSGSSMPGKRRVDQAGLDEEDRADNAVSSARVSDEAGTHHKARALSGADGRPIPRTERAGISGGPVQPHIPRTVASEREDELTDRDADADKEYDGLSDQDADAEMEDDVGPAYAATNHAPSQQQTRPLPGAATPLHYTLPTNGASSSVSRRPEVHGTTTASMSPSTPASAAARFQTDGSGSTSDNDVCAAAQPTGQRSGQFQVPVPPHRPAALSVGGNGSTGGSGSPGMSAIRYSVPAGNVRSSAPSYLHGN